MRVLIAGAGDVGVRLGKRLLESGAEVYALRRHPERFSAEDLRAGLMPIRADVRDLGGAELPLGVTHVAYCAAADTSSEAAYDDAYVKGVKGLAADPRLASSELRRFVFISSTAVYAQTDGRWVDENSPTQPTHFAGRKTLEAEVALRSAGVEHCIVRCAGIYGPGRTRLIDRVRSGDASYDPRVETFTNRIHSDDVAGVLAHVLLASEAPPTLNAIDDEPAAQREVLQWLAERLGVPPPVARESDANASKRRSPSNKRVSNRLLRSLGIPLAYPTFREGYGALLATL